MDDLKKKFRKLELESYKDAVYDSGYSENVIVQQKSRNIDLISEQKQQNKFKNINGNFITFRKPSKCKTKESKKCIPLSNGFRDPQINDQVNDSGDNTDDDNEYNNVNNDRDSIKRNCGEMTYNVSNGYIRPANVINNHPEIDTLLIPTKDILSGVSK